MVLRNKDVNARFKSPLLKELKQFCKKNKISFSCKDKFIIEKNKLREKDGLKPLSIGSTELGRIVMRVEWTNSRRNFTNSNYWLSYS